MKTNKFFMLAALVCGAAFVSCSNEDTPVPASKVTVATFEDINVFLNMFGYWNGGQVGEGVEGDWGETTYACPATTGPVTVTCNYSFMDYGGGLIYDWWSGVAISSRTGTELKDLDDQYNNIVGSGANGSANFGVIYSEGEAIINVEGGAEVSYMYVANSAYTMQNVLVGDGYSKKFEENGDHVYLIIEATKADGTTAEQTVKLAEFTTELSYIKGWEKVDLTSFGNDVTKLTFKMTAHNTGVPLYCCIDDIAVVTK